MAVPFAHGFHDAFEFYAADCRYERAFQRAREPWGSHIRFNLSWTHVQQWGPNIYTWKPQPGDYGHPFIDYETTFSQANARGLRVLPVAIGCPTGWISRSDRAACRPDEVNWGDPSGDWQHAWYPSTQTSWNWFANFCVEALKWWDRCQRVDGIEVWNEPNAPGSKTKISDANAYANILRTVAEKVRDANAAGYFSHPMTVVSGGLFMDYQAETWKSYLAAFKNLNVPFAVGIHPYDTRDHDQGSPPPTSDEAADLVVGRIQALYNQAADPDNGGTSRDLWVTETGASSRQPFGQGGQKRALRKLVGRETNGGFFATRARCKAVFVYRLYPNNENGEEEPTSPFRKFSVILPDPAVCSLQWSQKEGWWMLVNEWGP